MKQSSAGTSPIVIPVQFGVGSNPFALDPAFRVWCAQQNQRAVELEIPYTTIRELGLQYRQMLNQRKPPKRLPKNVVSLAHYRSRKSVARIGVEG